jgi:HD-GYP domain-containing protein (c-di-GMP phosphodiesterase class II)
VLGQVGGLQGQLLLSPIADLAICAAALVLVARSVAVLDSTHLLLLAGFILIAVADSHWAVHTAHGDYVSGDGVNSLYPMGAALIATAAWANVRIHVGITARRDQVSLALASAAAIGALVVLLWDHFDRLDLATVVLAGITLLAVVARYLLAHRAQFAAEARAGEVDRRIVTGLIAAVDARDHRTQDHSDRVTEYASRIAAGFSLSETQKERLRMAARFHDIGKLAVPERILAKAGRLTPGEAEQVKAHCAIGEQILQAAGLTDVARWVRSHQEHWDGSGYPDGLAGESIPLESRILAGADALDAMTSNRPYRRALSIEQAREEVKRCSGTHFDPRVAEAMVEIIDAGLVESPTA